VSVKKIVELVPDSVVSGKTVWWVRGYKLSVVGGTGGTGEVDPSVEQ